MLSIIIWNIAIKFTKIYDYDSAILLAGLCKAQISVTKSMKPTNLSDAEQFIILNKTMSTISTKPKFETQFRFQFPHFSHNPQNVTNWT